jgi:hypothetical protein
MDRLVRQIPDGCSHSAAKAALSEIASQRGWRCEAGRGESIDARWTAGDEGAALWEIEFRLEPPGGWGGEGVARVGLGFTEAPYFRFQCPIPEGGIGEVLLVQAATEYRDFLRAVDALPCAGDGIRPAWVRLWARMAGVHNGPPLSHVEGRPGRLSRSFLVLAESPQAAESWLHPQVVDALSWWAEGELGDAAPALAFLSQDGLTLAIQPRRGSAPSSLGAALADLCQSLSATATGA